jgi:tetratricopeptide (TPR) repeat protein
LFYMASRVKTVLLLLIFLSPVCLFADLSEDELFKQAESSYYSKLYSVALGRYTEFIETYPLSWLVPDAKYRSAVCLFRLGRYREAYEEFKAVETRFRTTRYIEYVPFWKGTSAFYLGMYREALKSYDSFLSRTDDTEFRLKAMLYKALSELSLNNYQNAKASIEQLVDEKGPGNLSSYEAVLYSRILLKADALDELIALKAPPDLEENWKEKFLLYKAEAYWRKGNYEEAGKIYNELQEGSDETASIAYRRLYTLAQKRNDFDTMESIIQKAEERFHGSEKLLEDLWERIGIESFKRQDLKLAEYFFTKVWNRGNYEDMNSITPLYLSEIYTKMGKSKDARRVLEEYVSLSRKEPESVMLKLANLYILEERYDEAAGRLEKLIKGAASSKPVDEAHYLYAFCQYRLGNYETALRYLNTEPDDPVYPDMLRLKSTVLIKMGKQNEALDAIVEYTRHYPDDVRARLDYIKLLFSMKRHSSVVSECKNLLSSFSDLERRDPFTFIQTNYLMGLSQISLKSYAEALDTLGKITKKTLETAGLMTILPYTEYYTGWAQYRLNQLKNAARTYDSFIKQFPEHELFDRALYTGAWCYFNMGDYEKAESLFTKLSEKKDSALSLKAQLLKGKSLENLKMMQEALVSFSYISSRYPDSSYADDALFEQANIMAERNRIEEAASMYEQLFQRYPDSELAEEALYKKGELLFSNDKYEEAKTSFTEYRNHYPDGKLIDASLYWEALCTQKLGEQRGAILLWENLIETQPESTFVPDALRLTGEAYTGFGEYRKALPYYERLINQYPEYAKSIDADLRVQEIRYLIFGLEKREAELTALISKNRGVETDQGRRAMLELSRIYIDEKKKLERAFQMLSQIVLKEDPATEADAQFLLGEYYRLTDDYVRAGEEFFNASLKKPEDKDFTAYSIFRAAQMMALAKRPREMEQLLEILKRYFPQSEWAYEGERLLESAQ